MKLKLLFVAFIFLIISCKNTRETKQTAKETSTQVLNAQQTSNYIDVHDLEPGKVTFADVAAAHQKDLATQNKYGVEFIRYWVDEAKGKVYCLSKAHDEESITKTHKEAHGLLPSVIYKVSDGPEAAMEGSKALYLDLHELGAGNVTAKDVAAAHEKDLSVDKKYGVNFINYWVNEKKGVVMCLSEAADSSEVI